MVIFLKNIFTLSFFVVLVCLCSASVQGAIEPVGEVSFRCQLNGGRIGDPIAFVIEVQLKKSVVIVPSSLSHLELRPVGANRQNLQKEFFEFEFTPFDHLVLAAKRSFTIKGVMRFYAPGEYQLVPLSLVCCLSESGDNSFDSDRPVTSTIVSNSIVVRIAGLHPDSDPPPALVIPEKDPQFKPIGIDGWDSRYRLYQYAIFLSFLLTFFLGIICYTCRKNTPALKLKGNVDPIKDMTKALAVTMKQVEVENHWCYLVDLDHLLRKFFLAKLDLPGGWKGGSGPTFVEQILPALGTEMATRLQLIWLEIDRIIAQESKYDPGFVKLRQQLRCWLRAYVGKKGADYGF